MNETMNKCFKTDNKNDYRFESGILKHQGSLCQRLVFKLVSYLCFSQSGYVISPIKLFLLDLIQFCLLYLACKDPFLAITQQSHLSPCDTCLPLHYTHIHSVQSTIGWIFCLYCVWPQQQCQDRQRRNGSLCHIRQTLTLWALILNHPDKYPFCTICSCSLHI